MPPLAVFTSPGPIVFRLGPLALRWYGLLIAAAVLIGLSLASRWLGRDHDLLEQLLHLIGQIIPISFQPVVEETLTRFLRQGAGAGLLGFLLLAFSANNIYRTRIDRAKPRSYPVVGLAPYRY